MLFVRSKLHFRKMDISKKMNNCSKYFKIYLDINTLLMAAIVLLVITASILFLSNGGNLYTNKFSIASLYVLCAHSLAVLHYEKQSCDPFIIILVANLVLFYIARVITLIVEPVSFAMSRYHLDVNSIIFTIFYIVLCNTSIVFGLRFAEKKNTNDKLLNCETKHHPCIAYIPLCLVFGYYLLYLFPINIYSRILQYFSSVIIHRATVFIIITVFLIFCYHKISLFSKIVIICCYTVYFIVVSLLGSRSGILNIFIWVGVSTLAINGRVKINCKFMILIFSAAVLSYFTFSYSTHIQCTWNANRQDPNFRVEMLSNMSKKLITFNSVRPSGGLDKRETRILFNRIGYLDCCADIVANIEKYEHIINLKYYLRSIVDNGLTPGFNIFETPRVANALSFVYYNKKQNPTHEDVLGAYQSDVLTVYGEYCALFGKYLSVLMLFVSAYAIKKVYLSIKSKNTLERNIFKALALYVFYIWINSFGIDWLFFDMLCISITTSLILMIHRVACKNHLV